jgi:hypothetical protein
MVKNYLVTGIRPIQSGSLIEKSPELYLAYQEMWQMALASYKKFVKEPFETVVWDGPVQDIDTACMENWYSIKELWNTEPCNIMWVGADTLMIRPTSLFSEKFSEFRLFNYSDPQKSQNLAHYFNDDVRYYPHTMSDQTWQLGEDYLKLRETAPDRHWGFDQHRHNVMFWSQNIADWHHPEMAYQAMYLRNPTEEIMPGHSFLPVEWHDQWNGIKIDQAHIVHFHASRGSRSVVNQMRSLCEKFGIEI